MQSKLFGAIGLAKRASKLICGSDAVLDGIRTGKALLVLAANDISENTKKRISDSCKYHNVDICYLNVSMAQLSDAIGKKCNTAAAYISDGNFVRVVRKAIDEDGGCSYGSTK